MPNPQTITRLEVSNVKRLRAVTISPQGNLVVIGGDNAQGKSSTLDAVAMAIGGKALVPERPIREGQTRASIRVETEELVIVREFKANAGSTLTVSRKDGIKLPKPQEVLDQLTSKVAFDPLEFIGLDPKKQAETLRNLAGIDFTELDLQRAAAYEARTDLNRQVKTLEAQLAAAPYDPELPKEEVSVAELAQRMQHLSDTANRNQRLREKLSDANDNVDEAISIVERCEEQLEAAKVALTKAKESLTRTTAERDALKATCAGLVDPDASEAVKAAEEAELRNQRIRANLTAFERNKELFRISKEARAKTDAIEKIDAAKAKQLEEANFPVPELSFDETGVVYRGVPFAQASGAEQLRVSMAVAMALAPTLKVCLIRDGSLLDDKNLALVAEMAAEAGAQVWLERVGHGQEVSVVIEDGQVSEVREKKRAQQPEPALA